MTSIWQRFKNFLKRFFPLTIFRFNREIQGLKKLGKRELKELRELSKKELKDLQEIKKNEKQELEENKRLNREIKELRELSKKGLKDLQELKEIGKQELQELKETEKKELQELKKIEEQELQELKKIEEQELQELQEIKKLGRNVAKIENAIIRCTPRAELTFEFALAEHCDLNCAGCNHYSPLAEPEFADYEEAARDFARLASLFHGLRQIRLLGGEPLLHPDLIKFLKMARENFPDGNITIVTNGLRLLNQPEEFWLACKANKITIQPTKYPISLNYEEMEKRAADYGVEYSYYNDTAVIKTLHYDKLNLRGLEHGNRNFLRCSQANKCIYLQHGRLYTCPTVATVRHFNKYFGMDVKECPEDSIDIYQAGSAREIMEFLARPIPFCRYCAIDQIQWGVPWHQSERSIEEWT